MIILIIVAAATAASIYIYNAIEALLIAYELADADMCSGPNIGITANVCVKLYENGSVYVIEVGR